MASTGLLPDQVRRSISWLSFKGLLDRQETSTFLLTAAGTPPPELLLLSTLEEGKGQLPLAELKKRFDSNQEFSAALGRASSAGWISIAQQKDGPIVALKDPSSASVLRRLLSVLQGGLEESKVGPEFRELSTDLLRRGLLVRKESRRMTMTITKEGEAALSSAGTERFEEKLTPELLASIRSSGATVRLRPIDVSAPRPASFLGGGTRSGTS